MKRLMIALALTAVLSIAAACGSHEEDESQFIATAVPTYTVVAPGTSQTTAPAPATEEEQAADGEAEETTETVAAPVVAETAVEAEIAEEAVEEEAKEVVEEPEPTTASEVVESEATESGDTAADDAESDATMADEPVDEQADDDAAGSEAPTETEEADEATSSEATGDEETAEDDETSDVDEDAGAAEDNIEEVDIYAGLPEAIAVLMPSADPAHGEQLSLMNGCIGCHNLDPALVMAGPTWYNVGTTAETRVEGQTAAQYLHSSIVNPNDHVVEGFAPKIMIPTYGETLSEQDQADLVAYLLSLHE